LIQYSEIFGGMQGGERDILTYTGQAKYLVFNNLYLH
jgi:hypothetical protein